MNIMMPSISNQITTGEKFYFGTFLLVLCTSGIPMLASAVTYNTKMNSFGKLLGDSKTYDVDSMPWRLRYKLIQDVMAMGAGIVATCLGSSGTGPMLVTITTFDLLGAVTSGIVAVKTKLKAEWVPVTVHGLMGMWGLTLCWQHHIRH